MHSRNMFFLKKKEKKRACMTHYFICPEKQALNTVFCKQADKRSKALDAGFQNEMRYQFFGEKQKRVEMRGIDPRASRMLSERSTI
jgi:hypothetical protein